MKREAAKGQVAVDVAFWGGAVPGQPRPAAAAARGGRRRLQVLPARLGRAGVPAAGRRRAAGGARPSSRPSTALLIAHAEDADVIAAAPEPAGASYAGFLASRPGAAEETAIGRLVAAARDTGARGARRPPGRRRRAAAAARGPAPRACGSPSRPARTTSPSPPSRCPTAATAFKCCPPIREARAPRGAVGGAARRRRRPRRQRPLARARPSSSGSTSATSGWPGAASPRCRWRCPRCGAAPARAGVGADRRRPVDGGGAGAAGRAAAQGRDRGREGRRPGRLRARRAVDRRRAAAPQPGHALRRPRAHRRRPADLAARAARRRIPDRPAARAAACQSERRRRPEEPDERRHPPARPGLAARSAGRSSPPTTSSSRRRRTSSLPEPAAARTEFGHKGKEYDGWETRRRRAPGHDWAVVRLGAPGIVAGVVVDTAFFTGNYPPRASVDGAAIEGHPLGRRAGQGRLAAAAAAVGPGRRHRQRLRRRLRPAGHPRAAEHPPRRRGRPAAGARHGRCPTRGWSTPARSTSPRWRTAGRSPAVSNEFYGQPAPADRPRPGPLDGRGLGDRPPPRPRQRLGRGRRWPARAWSPSPSSTPPTSSATPPARASLTGIGPDGEVAAAAAHPAAARHPAPVRARRARPASTGCGSTSSPTAAWPGCGCGDARRRPGGRRWDGAGSTRCPTSRRWRCSARSACRRSEAGRLVGAPAGARGPAGRGRPAAGRPGGLTAAREPVGRPRRRR